MESDYFPIPPPPKATDLDEAYLQISSYLTNWLHKHPKMVRISETKVVTSNGAYVLDELIGFAHQDGIGFGLEYQLVPSFDVCSREQMVNETVSLIQEMTQIWLPFPVILILTGNHLTTEDEIYFSRHLETNNCKIVACKSGIGPFVEPVSQKFVTLLSDYS